jgi:hypothetical protein
LNRANLEKYAELTNVDLKLKQPCRKPRPKSRFSVTDLTDYIPSDVIFNCSGLFETLLVSPRKTEIRLRSETRQAQLFEDVSDINGQAVVAYLEYSLNLDQPLSFYSVIQEKREELREEIRRLGAGSEFESLLDEFPEPLTSQSLIRLIILYQIASELLASKKAYLFRLKQISSFNWFPQSILEKCYQRCVKKITGREIQFERLLLIEFENQEIYGRIDCQADSQIWEIKAVRDLKKTHFIQLALYAFLAETEHPGGSYYLFNVRTNEVYQILFRLENLAQILRLLLSYKLTGGLRKEDLVFREKILKIKDSVLRTQNGLNNTN